MAKLIRGTVLTAAVAGASLYAIGEAKGMWDENRMTEAVKSSLGSVKSVIPAVTFSQENLNILTVAKKTWNDGVISSCLYIQQNLDAPAIGRAVADNIKESCSVVANKVYDAVTTSETPDSHSSTENNPEKKD